MSVGTEVRTYFLVLWHKRWAVASSAAIALVVALAISAVLTPVYGATATLRVASAPGGVFDYGAVSLSTRLSNTYVEIATSDAMREEVARRLDLKVLPNWRVDVVPETELLRIAATHTDPQTARDIANTLASIMVEGSTKFYSGDGPTARQILETEVTSARLAWEASVKDYDAAIRESQPAGTPAADATPTASAQIDGLRRLMELRNSIYTDLLQRYESARLTEQLRANTITLVEPAQLPLYPSSPRLPLNAALGLGGGLVLGIVLAFFLESLDTTLRDVEEIKSLTSLSVLSQIPATRGLPRLQSVRDGAAVRVATPVDAAFRRLRSRLLLSERLSKPTTLLITSAEPQAGKTTVATRLAVALAETHQRVILVDLDFLRPQVHTAFGLERGVGLSDYLCGVGSLEQIIRPTILPGLQVVTAGSIGEVPAVAMTPGRVRHLLRGLVGDCDYVLLDSPALLASGDLSLLGTQADAVILVVAVRQTERSQIRLAQQLLADIAAPVLGVVVNKVPLSGAFTYYAASVEPDIGKGNRAESTSPEFATEAEIRSRVDGGVA